MPTSANGGQLSGTSQDSTQISLVCSVPANNPPNNANETITVFKNSFNNDNIVVLNNTDPDGDSVYVSIMPFVSSLGGVVTLLPNGSVSYIPPSDTCGVVDTVIYTVCDNGTPSLCVQDTLFIEIINTITPPVAVNDTASTFTNTSISVDALVNDSDPDSDPITITIIDSTDLGGITVNPNGNITYSPYTGTVCTWDVLEYQICDTTGLCDTAEVYFFVSASDSDNDGIADHIEGTNDPDNDSIPNYLDTDSDGDGIPDTFEALGDLSDLCNPILVDTDSDSIPDFLDTDSDNDCVDDALENSADSLLDTDSDGVLDFRDPDSDDDGISDCDEYVLNNDGILVDCDNDGIPNWLDADQCPEELFIPEAFSPDGDNYNDYFVVPDIENYPNNTLEVYNRWGNKVYEASPYGNEFEGLPNSGILIGSDRLPVGTYFYVIDLGDGSDRIVGYVYLTY